jgi:hypothetical protein
VMVNSQDLDARCTTLSLTIVYQQRRKKLFLDMNRYQGVGYKGERHEWGAHMLVGSTAFTESEKNLRRNSGMALICPVKD